MEKINALYLTTSIQKKIAKLNYRTNIRQGNPSNQNFHNRLIGVLSLYYNLRVLSYRSYAQEVYEFHKDENYFYSKCSNSLLYKLFLNQKNINVLANRLSKDTKYIFVDSMNIKLLKAALKLQHDYHLKVIAIVTDNPENISNVPNKYIKTWKQLIVNADAYIVVMDELKKLLPDKPCVRVSGLLPNFKNIKPHKEIKPYIYFAGALYKRYGVNLLIDAYKDSDISKKYNLIIAGHGELEKKISNDHKIKFIHQVDEDTNLSYMLGASLLVNPRPYVEKMDKESIPSKMIEYIMSNRPILSTKHSLLKRKLGNNIYWIKDDFNGFLAGFKAFSQGKVVKSEESMKIIKKYFNNIDTLKKVIALVETLA